jgi:predicted metal-dependent phosphoesterase TrpH
MLIDLHTHSKASDGSMTPRELVRHARDCGLSAIALTDHDTIDGIPEAVEEAQLTGLELIPGVEIGVDFSTEMHILGYFTKANYRCIGDTLSSLRKSRDERNPKIVSKLKELGFDISMKEVEKEAGGGVTGRPHIAAVLIRKGYVKDVREAFDMYLSAGKPAYFKKDKLTPSEGINKIAGCGGIPVLAHPVLLGMDYKQLDALLFRLTAYGLKGIEAYYVENTPKDTRMFLELAEKYKLIATGGSDFHGSFKSGTELGVGHGNLVVPYEVLAELKRKL